MTNLAVTENAANRAPERFNGSDCAPMFADAVDGKRYLFVNDGISRNRRPIPGQST